MLKPIYNPLSKKFGKNLAAILSILLVFLIIIIPLSLILSNLVQQISHNLTPQYIADTIKEISALPILQEFSISSESLAEKINIFILKIAQSIIFNLPTLLISVVITIIGSFYILKQWDYLSNSLRKYLPFEKKEKISKEIGDATRGIVYGYALIALVEFIIGIIGFYLSGVKLYLLFAALIGILAFIPGLGPIFVWLPLAIFSFISGSYGTAIGITITGIIISVLIDNLAAPKIIGSKSNIHPFVILVGVLGGISVFGLFGFIIGPLILVYTIKIIEGALKED